MKTVMTVTGPVSANELGITLMHEHITVNGFEEVWHVDPSDVPGLPPISPDAPLSLELLGAVRRSPAILKDNLVLCSEDVMVEELSGFKVAGGGCVVDVSCEGIRGDVRMLKRISERTGLHIVAATGFYLEASWPQFAREGTVDQLAQHMVDECRTGIGDTGIRPGIIGEIGTSTLTPGEVKLLRAAARASSETGLSICVHTNVDQLHGGRIIDILVEEGMEPARIIMTHLGENTFERRVEVLEKFPERALANLDYVKSVLDRGVIGGFDGFGKEYYSDDEGRGGITDVHRIAAVLKLVESGYASQLVLSNDVWQKFLLHRYGGWGYDHVQVRIVPRLLAQGVPSYEVRQMLEHTPARLLAA